MTGHDINYGLFGNIGLARHMGEGVTFISHTVWINADIPRRWRGLCDAPKEHLNRRLMWIMTENVIKFTTCHGHIVFKPVNWF